MSEEKNEEQQNLPAVQTPLSKFATSMRNLPRNIISSVKEMAWGTSLDFSDFYQKMGSFFSGITHIGSKQAPEINNAPGEIQTQNEKPTDIQVPKEVVLTNPLIASFENAKAAVERNNGIVETLNPTIVMAESTQIDQLPDEIQIQALDLDNHLGKTKSETPDLTDTKSTISSGEILVGTDKNKGTTVKDER